MGVEVTSIAGIARSRFASPAAVFVITRDDIRRSGHRTLAEALRLAPGVFVGRTATHGWTIGARGLTGNNITSTRSLVLIDGRVVYDPLFNGTLWDVVDVALEDVDRIEVIRGPGATLWGANAVNGVINVITRSARDTQGTFLLAGAGDREQFATARHGGAVPGGGAYRVWGKYSDDAPFELADGSSAHDQWTRARAGFRVDATGERGVDWTLQGDLYENPTTRVVARTPVPDRHLQFDTRVTDDDVDGGYLRFRAESGVGEDSGWSLQGYYDHTNRETSRLGVRRDTFDLDLRGWSRWRGRHEVLWGVQYTDTADRLENMPQFLFDPEERSWSTVNGFVQLTGELIPGRLHAMAGSKVTYHEFVGVEAQPGARLWWTPSDRQTLWAAVSRPVRVPSRLEEDGFIVLAYADPGLIFGPGPTGEFLPFGVAGDEDLDVEKMVSYEVGHRVRLGADWELDTALFFNDYSTLISIPEEVIGSFTDAGSGETYGGDLLLSGRLSERWRLAASYSHLEVEIRGPVSQTEEQGAPENLAQLRSSWDVRDDLGLHAALYYVDRIPGLGIDPYERLDLGLTWQPAARVELALWGQNLLDSAHLEASPVAIPRSFYAQVEVGF